MENERAVDEMTAGQRVFHPLLAGPSDTGYIPKAGAGLVTLCNIYRRGFRLAIALHRLGDSVRGRITVGPG